MSGSHPGRFSMSNKKHYPLDETEKKHVQLDLLQNMHQGELDYWHSNLLKLALARFVNRESVPVDINTFLIPASHNHPQVKRSFNIRWSIPGDCPRCSQSARNGWQIQ